MLLAIFATQARLTSIVSPFSFEENFLSSTFSTPRNSILSLAVLGVAQTFMLAIALPVFFHIGINSDSGHRGELATYLCFLSTLGAFIFGSRRPFYGGLWLLVAGAICAAWTISDLDGPFYAPMLLTPQFWWADLPIIWAVILMLAAWVTQPQAAKPSSATR